MNTQIRSAIQSNRAAPLSPKAASRRSQHVPGLLRSLVLAALAGVVSPSWAAEDVLLGTADDFGALAGSTVTNTGSTVITGSVGVSPGTSITGFPPGIIAPSSGTFHSADAVALQAQSDLTIAYNDAAGRPCDETIAGDQLGGLTLTPGVYCLGAADLTGTLTLDGQGVYIFKMASTLITASNSSVNLINGASACDVYWQVTSSATLGTNSAMAGTIMALESITMNTGSSLIGGALMARTGAVTLDGNDVSACASASSIVVEKLTVPTGGTGFTFTGDAAGTIDHGGQITVDNLEPGNYSSVEEVPTGWSLTNIICDDDNSSGDVGQATANFVVEAFETVTCVFTNVEGDAQVGTIIVEKQTLPNGSAATFEFTGTELSGTIGDGERITVNDLDPGSYTSTEIVPDGWTLVSIVCDDTDSSGDTATATATFNLEAGEVVRCVFTNSQNPVTVTVSKSYTDGEQAPVDVTLLCPDAIVDSPNPAAASPGSPAVFTVSNFPAEGTPCWATESNLPSDYAQADTTCGDSANPGMFIGPDSGDQCSFTNAPTRATFSVIKDFTDGNPMDVEVTISCNTGLPLEQSKEINENDGVEFVVTSFDAGELDCDVTETQAPGYIPAYTASAATGQGLVSHDDEGCHFDEVVSGQFVCSIVNTPGPVDIVIHKDWVFEGSSDPQGIDQRYDLTLWCDAEIVGGFNFGESQEAPSGIIRPFCGPIILAGQDAPQGIADWCKPFFGEGPETFIAEVIPEFPESLCFVIERLSDSAVEVDNGCRNLTVSAGNGAECTITNTVFFEGIPTLNQYGLALLALLMLGVGFVGFRRLA